MAGGAIEGCAGRGKSEGGGCAVRQGIFGNCSKVRKYAQPSKFGASGTGCCNVRASNFRPAKIHPATGNLNVDNFRIAGLLSRRNGVDSGNFGRMVGIDSETVK
jgi:hypothetical protein